MTTATHPVNAGIAQTPLRLLSARTAGIAGILFVVLGTVPAFAIGTPPDPGDAPAKFLAFYQDHRSAIIAADFIGVITTVVALVFFAKLLTVLRRAEGGQGTLTVVALLEVVATATVVTVGVAVSAATAFRVGNAQHLGAEAVVTLNDAANIMFIASGLPFAAFLATNAVVILRSNLLPSWLGIVAAAAAAVSLASALGMLTTTGSFSPGGGVATALSNLSLGYVFAASIAMVASPAQFDEPIDEAVVRR